MLKRLYNVRLNLNKFYLQYNKQYNARRMMSNAAENKVGLSLKEVVQALHNFADTSFAASWDNVGLLIEPTEPKIVSRILLTNDLTENVMNEAIDLGSDLIITYHPLIFAPLKTITTQTWKVPSNCTIYSL